MSDKRRATGDAGQLEGIPVAVKDLFCVKGSPTTAGSLILENFVPPYNSTVTLLLQQQGAILFGKTNLDEFGMGSTGENSAYSTTINPYSVKDGVKRVPGGSSGGSAAAVASRTVPAALGTDTGGSCRQPGAFCGVVGMKPSYGRCSRYGMIAFASSLDQAGVLSSSTGDAAAVLQVMAGHDAQDSTSVDVPVPNYEESLQQGVRGMTIGIPSEYYDDDMPESTLRVRDVGIEWLKKEGAKIKEISLPGVKYALAAYYVIAPAEASSNLSLRRYTLWQATCSKRHQ